MTQVRTALPVRHPKAATHRRAQRAASFPSQRFLPQSRLLWWTDPWQWCASEPLGVTLGGFQPQLRQHADFGNHDRVRSISWLLCAVLALGACARSEDSPAPAASPSAAPSVSLDDPSAPVSVEITPAPPEPPSTETPEATSVSTTVEPPMQTTTSTITTTTTSTTTTPVPEPTTTPYVIPVANASSAGWGDNHSTYPATDIFENGCGNSIVSPVNGVLLEVRRINSYDPAIDNPATRGGRSISILGDDAVRYYLAHFELIDELLVPGQRVAVEQYLGTIGTTGRSSACHVHFGISPPCPDQEWSVRRGAIWPYRYLNDWKSGGQLSPVDEVTQFLAANPDACSVAAADPTAPDSLPG
jgi:hypothetical protein